MVFYDQLGCRRSDKPDDTSLRTVEHFVRELEAVRSALELDHFHVFGSSWGGMLALQPILDYRPASVASPLMAAAWRAGRAGWRAARSRWRSCPPRFVR